MGYNWTQKVRGDGLQYEIFEFEGLKISKKCPKKINIDDDFENVAKFMLNSKL